MNDIPIVRLSIEGMKQTMLYAFSDYQIATAEEVRRALEEATTPEAIHELCLRIARQEIERAVRSEVERFYRYGSGQQAVRRQIMAMLEPEAPQ